MANIKTISVLGAGAMAWGIAYILEVEKGNKIRVWDRDQQLIAEARENGTNTKNSIPEIKLEEASFSTDLKETVEGTDLVLLGVPSFAVREMAQRLSKISLPPLLMISKGMEKETSLLPFQIIEQVLRKKDILHLTGAGYGKEVHRKIPATEALASRNGNLLSEVKKLIETNWLTIKTSTDLLGTQLAGALKNVMVIGMGMALGFKNNPELRSKLIEESVREMISLGKTMGAEEETFWGPAGKGDLEISADPLSRNYRLGQSLAEKGIDEIKKELKEKGITVEGFHTAYAVHQLTKKYGVDLPIIEEVHRAIYERKNPAAITKKLIQSVR